MTKDLDLSLLNSTTNDHVFNIVVLQQTEACHFVFFVILVRLRVRAVALVLDTKGMQEILFGRDCASSS